MGGSEQTVPHQATVIILCSSGVLPQLTITTGRGLSKLAGGKDVFKTDVFIVKYF
jgi:hypothetical protein